MVELWYKTGSYTVYQQNIIVYIVNIYKIGDKLEYYIPTEPQ